MLTIGIDYTAAVQQSAGIGRYIREMVQALAALPTEQQYRLFVAGADKNFTLSLPGPHFEWSCSRLSERWLSRLWYRLRLPLRIENWTGAIDLFHAPDFFLPPVKPQTRTLVTIHDLSFVREPETTMPGMEHHLHHWVPTSVSRADHIIAVSEATRQDLIELYQTPPEKITTFHHGVSDKFKPIDDPKRLLAVRQRYGLDSKPFILSVGTLQPRKNYRRLIQAFAHLEKSFQLVIVGSKGWRYEEIFTEVVQQKLEDRVHFPGFVTEADLPILYQAATLFVYPSLYEGFGLPVLEAMACGTPVIASNQSALPEVVGEAGVLIDPYDTEALTSAMEKLIEDSNLRQQFSEAGLGRAKKFRWEEMAHHLLNLYQNIVEA